MIFSRKSYNPSLLPTIKGSSQQGLWAATMGYFIGMASVSLFGPMVQFFRSDVGIDPILAGLLISIPSFSGSLLRIPFSAWTEKNGGKKPFIILLFLAILGLIGLSFLMQVEPSRLKNLYPLLLFFGILGGCGIATFSVGITQTSYWFPSHKQGTALGVYAGLGTLGPGIFTLLLSYLLLPYLGLAKSYIVWTIFLIVGTILYSIVAQNAWFFQLKEQGLNEEEAKKEAKEKYHQEFFPAKSLKATLSISAKVPQLWLLVSLYFLNFGGFLALTAWFPGYWSNYFGFSLKIAGLLTAVYSLLASLFRIGGGKIADQYGGRKITLIFLLCTAVGAALMTFSSTLLPALGGIFFLALGMGVVNGAVFKMLPDLIPHAIGGAAGWVGGLGAFGGFILPIILSIFLVEGEGADPGYAQGFSIFIGLALLLFLILYVSTKKKTRI